MKYSNYMFLFLCLSCGLSLRAMQYSDNESEETQHSLETIGVIDHIDSDRELIHIIEKIAPPAQEELNNKEYVTIPKQQFTTFLLHIIKMQKDYYSLKVEISSSTSSEPKSPMLAHK